MKKQKWSKIGKNKVNRIYIELGQFEGDITEEMIEVKMEETSLDVKIVDEDSNSHTLNI